MYSLSNLNKLGHIGKLAPETMEAGVTETELAETVHVAAALRAGGALTHGTHLFEG